MKKISFKANLAISIIGITATIIMDIAIYFNICSAWLGFIIVFCFVIFCNTRNMLDDGKQFCWVKTEILSYSQKEIDTIKEDTKTCYYVNLVGAIILLFSFALCDGIISSVFIIISLLCFFFECGSYFQYTKKDNWDKIAVDCKKYQEMKAKMNDRIIEQDKNIKALSNKFEQELGKPDKMLIARKDSNLLCVTFVFEQAQHLILATSSKVYDIPFCTLKRCNIYDSKDSIRNLSDYINPPTAATTTIQTTDTGSMVKRAVVGAAIGGVAGAAVGALTAKKTSVTQANTICNNLEFIAPEYILNITTSEPSNSNIKILFGEEIEMATKLLIIIEAIIRTANKEAGDIKVEDVSL